jgi:osmoprotectant transport system ATP-binding protein
MPKLEPQLHPAIAFDGVSKAYGATAAIDAVTLDIPHGQFVALVGGSGAGKTTLLKTINALIAPDAGVVRVEGRPTAEVEPPDLRRGIGYVFQEIGLFPHLSVARNIAITPRLLGWSEADIAARVAELLDLVALPRDFAARKPAALSGGQRQRVGVARALAARPKVMLMDEPFGALDPVTRSALGEDYRRLHEDLGLTTVMVTHDVMEAALLADRIVVMKAGAVVADGTPKALLAGHPDPDVAAMMQTPRRQAERIEALLHG